MNTVSDSDYGIKIRVAGVIGVAVSRRCFHSENNGFNVVSSPYSVSRRKSS